jgi:predicted metal-binding protein
MGSALVNELMPILKRLEAVHLLSCSLTTQCPLLSEDTARSPAQMQPHDLALPAT